MTERPARIALVGNLANVAYNTCRALREASVQADLFLLSRGGTLEYTPDSVDPGISRSLPEWVRVVRIPGQKSASGWPANVMGRVAFAAAWRAEQFRWWFQLRHYDLIMSFTCEPIWVRRIGRPYVAFATGSDLRESAQSGTRTGRRAREIFKHAEMVLHGPDPGHVEAVRELGIVPAYLARQVIDTDFYAEGPGEEPPDSEDLVVFHPTRLDWSDASAKWSKANHRLFKGFADFIKSGRKGRLVYIERGADIEPTRRLVAELGIASRVTVLKADLEAPELRRWYVNSHVTADQFNNGGFGRIALEAMSCRRPVLVDVDAEAMRKSYSTTAPLCSCKSETEICSWLCRLYDSRELRAEVGRNARTWVVMEHSKRRVAEELIWHFERVLGRKVQAIP